MVHEFSDANFSNEVEKSNDVVLVDFWAPWCTPCRIQGPIVDQLAEEYSHEGKIKIGKVNVDENPSVSQQFQIMSIPTLILFKGGKVADHMIGLQTKESLKSRMQKLLG